MNRIHIEFQRVQTWLFAVPKLRAMLGANTLLGETLRVELPQLAKSHHLGWQLASVSAVYPSADPSDPLQAHDDPAADCACGILSRDGGHFEANFAKGADVFAEAAGKLLRRKLPGLSFRISIDGRQIAKSQVYVSNELPVLAPCAWTGSGLASETVSQGGDRFAVSIDVKQRHEHSKNTENGKANDLASLLCEQTEMRQLRRPEDLEELVGNGYLALIHADGNGVGAGAGESDSERANFFHRNRVFLRRALKETLDATCIDWFEQNSSSGVAVAPLIPLMLGGDDLLIVCRAGIALPFVAKLCKTLEEIQQAESTFKLTLGVGVVFAKHNIPIHRLHECAEQLATSAKRRFRGLVADGQQSRSVVDWSVFSTSWVDDPEEVRRRDWIRTHQNNLRVLSQRPLDVLGSELNTLEGLLQAAKLLAGAPRSQLRFIVDQLPHGRALSELAFSELTSQASIPLANAGIVKAWQRGTGETWSTPLLDLVEVVEIERLGKTRLSRQAEGEELVNA
jgi:hypothetical protein